MTRKKQGKIRKGKFKDKEKIRKNKADKEKLRKNND